MIIVDKDRLLRHLPDQKKKSIPLKVRGIEVLRHKFAQFAVLSLFFPGEDDEKRKIYASIKCELHLLKCLSAKILIGNNNLAPESFVLNIGLSYAIVGSCSVKITIKARQKDQFWRRKIHAKNDRVVSPAL